MINPGEIGYRRDCGRRIIRRVHVDGRDAVLVGSLVGHIRVKISILSRGSGRKDNGKRLAVERPLHAVTTIPRWRPREVDLRVRDIGQSQNGGGDPGSRAGREGIGPASGLIRPLDSIIVHGPSIKPAVCKGSRVSAGYGHGYESA